MLIQHILESKPQTNVLTITKDKLVKDAVSELSSNRIGALVVSDDGRSVDGIISERDIIRELGKRGTDCLTDKISDFMTKKIVNCSKSDTAEQALQMMTEGRFRHLPVVENGKMIGLISIGDVVKARLTEVESEHSAMVDMIRGY